MPANKHNIKIHKSEDLFLHRYPDDTPVVFELMEDATLMEVFDTICDKVENMEDEANYVISGAFDADDLVLLKDCVEQKDGATITHFIRLLSHGPFMCVKFESPLNAIVHWLLFQGEQVETEDESDESENEEAKKEAPSKEGDTNNE